MLFIVLSGFVIAFVAPWLTRWLRGATGWVLALLPLGYFAYFLNFIELVRQSQPVLFSYPWAESLGVRLSFCVDGLSLLFALLITGIGALILIYSGGYLAGHDKLGRFYAFILAFLASMLGLVLADNVLTLFVFWELTSLTSFFLIGFDHDRDKARAAAWQALLVTSSGGLALMAGLLLLGLVGGSYELSQLRDQTEAVQQALSAKGLYLPVLLLLLAGAFTKSAQFPFHFWLPSAMEAPTPVSAYLHSASMVKAGIYLLARLQPLLGFQPEWHYLVTSFGAATMVVGALMAMRAVDLKMILAYATVSALGLLTMLLGVGTRLAVQGAMIFLLAHALYKATLFLVAGAIDHETGTRNVGQLSGLGRAMPLTALAAFLGGLSMAGLPPSLGFLGKEYVLEAILEDAGGALLVGASVLANMIFVAVAAIVAIGPFVGRRKNTPKHPHEGSVSLWLTAGVLGILSLALGFRPDLLDDPLLTAAVAATIGTVEFPAVHLVLWHGWTFVLTLSLITFGSGIILFFLSPLVRRLAEQLHPVLNWGPALWYEWGLRGLNTIAEAQTRLLQNGKLRYYLLTILATIVVLLGYTLFRLEEWIPPLNWKDVKFYEAGLGILLVLGILAAVLSRLRFTAVLSLGVVGYSVALIFAVFNAPDLAMTQFLIETLTVVLFVLVLYQLPEVKPVAGVVPRLRDGMIALAVGAVMTVVVLLATSELFYPPVSDYYLEQSKPLAHGRNIVNVILVDFRGLDTLGEITVLAMAGMGVYALLRFRVQKKEAPSLGRDQSRPDASPDSSAEGVEEKNSQEERRGTEQ